MRPYTTFALLGNLSSNIFVNFVELKQMNSLNLIIGDGQNDENCEPSKVKSVQNDSSQVRPGRAMHKSAQSCPVLMHLEFILLF